MLNENVKKLLAESMWDMATCADNEPNVVPVAFKDVTEDGKLVAGAEFMETLCTRFVYIINKPYIHKFIGYYSF